jgi:hypothetical protein
MLFLTSYRIFANCNSDDVEHNHIQDKENPLLYPQNHSAGIAIGTIISDVSLGIPTLVIMQNYQYRISSLFALEILLSFAHSTVNSERYRMDSSLHGIPMTQEYEIFHRIGHFLIANATIVCTPFTTNNIQFGLGPSVRWAGLLSTNISTQLSNLQQKISVTDTQQYAFGANAHIEYLFPLYKNIQFSCRIHSQLFAPPFEYIGGKESIGVNSQQILTPVNINNFLPPNYGITLGCSAFLRVSF